MAFNENTRVKIPAILHLCRLGFNYISLSKAKWDLNTNIFTGIFKESILRINPDIEEGDLKRHYEDISLLNYFMDYFLIYNLKTSEVKIGLTEGHNVFLN